MNYWPAHVAGLSECARPLLSLVRDLSETGARTARQQSARCVSFLVLRAVVIVVVVLCALRGACGADPIITRVGSSSPETSGLDGPLTYGSSLIAKTVPFASRSVAWFVTVVPLAMAETSRMSN